MSELVDRALSSALGLDRHSLFQVSTSNALVQGVFRAAVTVGDLKRHGDFGLGTFEDLDGELVMLDGVCYRATAAGAVTHPDDSVGVPFAVITQYHPDKQRSLDSASLSELVETVDEERPSENLFAGVRVDGRFDRLSMRAACAAAPGETLLEATAHQSEFEVEDIEGTLVGFWAPLYARAVNVPGYHFHFISQDRLVGGHLLAMAGRQLDIGLHLESELHIAIPETAEFLQADLSGDHGEDLARAETGRRD
jgi:acetolactate decarboxylase